MKRVDVGVMNWLIQIQRREISQTDLGQNESWVDFGPRRWARQTIARTQEASDDGVMQSNLLVIWTLRLDSFSEQIKPGDHVVHDGQIFSISGTRPVNNYLKSATRSSSDYRRRAVELHCVARNDL